MGAGRPTSLTAHEETELVTSLKLLSQWGFGLTRAETQEVVGDYIKTIGRDTQFVDGMPGVDWLDSLFKRHPELTLRLPEQLKSSRAKSSGNKLIYEHWFKLLGDILRDNDLLGKPERVYNVDESGFPLDPKRIKVITERGISHLYRIIGGSGRENITVQGCARADGLMLPPYVLYSAMNLRSKWTEGGPDGARYNVNQKGWMDMTCFHDWFSSAFVPSLPPERPVVLIFDGHASHLNINTIKEAVKNNIIILKLPSNTTHVLQPLDVGVYGPVKTKWEKILVGFARQNLGIPLSKELFPQLLKNLWESDSMRPENIRAGFKKCGVMPFDPSQISVENYESAEIFDRPLQEAQALPATTPSESGLASSSSPIPTSGPTPSSLSPVVSSSSLAPPITAEASVSPTLVQPSPCVAISTPLSPRSNQKKTVKDFLLAKITPLIKKPTETNVNRQRAIKRQYAESLTSEECIQRLLAEEEEKAAKKARGRGKGKGKGKKSSVPSTSTQNDSEEENSQPLPSPEPVSDYNDDSDNDPDWAPRPVQRVNRNIFDIEL